MLKQEIKKEKAKQMVNSIMTDKREGRGNIQTLRRLISKLRGEPKREYHKSEPHYWNSNEVKKEPKTQKLL